MNFYWKKLNNERAWLTLLLIGGFLWIFGSFFFNLSFPETDYNFLGTTNKVKLNPGAPVTQIFTATENNLNQIKIILKNSDIPFREKIVFELADATCNQTLATNTYRFYHSSPFIYYRLTFPEIPHSAGQTYCFKVTSFSPYDRGDERPYLGASEGEQFIGLSYTNTGNGRIYENRTLQMRPSYGTGSLSNDLGRLNDRVSQYKPIFLKGVSLTILSFVFLFSTLTLVWLLVFKKEKE